MHHECDNNDVLFEMCDVLLHYWVLYLLYHLYLYWGWIVDRTGADLVLVVVCTAALVGKMEQGLALVGEVVGKLGYHSS